MNNLILTGMCVTAGVIISLAFFVVLGLTVYVIVDEIKEAITEHYYKRGRKK